MIADLGKYFIIITLIASLAESDDKCTNCSDKKYNPICAQSDSNTIRFVNECWMDYENNRSGSNFKKLNIEDDCTRFENTGCAFKCSSEPNEVCAYNGDEYREFVNSCQMISVNCRNPKSKYQEKKANIFILFFFSLGCCLLWKMQDIEADFLLVFFLQN